MYVQCGIRVRAVWSYSTHSTLHAKEAVRNNTIEHKTKKQKRNNKDKNKLTHQIGREKKIYKSEHKNKIK